MIRKAGDLSQISPDRSTCAQPRLSTFALGRGSEGGEKD
jgi:hypothetical protein